MNPALCLDIIPEVAEPSGVFCISEPDIVKGNPLSVATSVIGKLFARFEIQGPHDTFGAGVARAGAHAGANIVERRHLVEGAAGKFEAAIRRNGNIGVCAVD